MDEYTVIMRIWHTGDECYYEAGTNNVTMTHLTDRQIERLVSQGVIKLNEYVMAETKATKAKRKREVKQNGNTDSTRN